MGVLGLPPGYTHTSTHPRSFVRSFVRLFVNNSTMYISKILGTSSGGASSSRSSRRGSSSSSSNAQKSRSGHLGDVNDGPRGCVHHDVEKRSVDNEGSDQLRARLRRRVRVGRRRSRRTLQITRPLTGTRHVSLVHSPRHVSLVHSTSMCHYFIRRATCPSFIRRST